MRILFQTQVLPYPLDAGPKIRAYYTLRHLSRRHEVTLLSLVRPSDPPDAIEHLQGFCRVVYTVPMRRSPARDPWHLLRSLAKDTPFLIAGDWVPEMAELINELTSQSTNFDVIHADQLWMAPYALRAKSTIQQPKAKAQSPSLVLDEHNAVYLIPQRLAQYECNPLKRALLALEGHKLARYEVQMSQ